MDKTLTRRNFLSLRREAVAPAPAPRRVTSGLTPYSGPWTKRQALHLLRRTLFGAKKQEVLDTLDLGGPFAAVNALMTTGTPPPPPVNNYNSDRASDPAVPFGETWVNAPFSNDFEYARYISLKGWWLEKMMQQAPTLEEKMVLFWHNHLATQAGGVFNARMWYRHLVTLRQHALGNFKDMVRAITIDPLMLIYLNGAFSQAGAPDENYARELQELFCIGKGPNANFSEEDVQAAARALTGWRVDWDNLSSFFEPYFHDTTDKTFSSFYGSRVINGKTGEAGAEELDELLDMIFDNPETALFICRKLYRFFIYREISEQAEQEVIEPLADIFRSSGYEIRPVLETLLRSEHFYDEENIAAVIKSPLDHIVGIIREYNIAFPDTTQLSDGYTLRMYIWYNLLVLLQDPGDPPNVAGWPAWYQAPQFDRYWISTDTLPRRAEFSDAMLFYGYSTDNFVVQIDTVAYTASMDNPLDPNALIDEALLRATDMEVSAESRQTLKSILLSGQLSDYYWSSAWYDYTLEPSNGMKRFVVESRLKVFYKYLMQLEECQLM
ncbi:MAG: DUF1800 domain-containing protein [Bacteroidetes bacterium]|nr:MAG: DUF1800 domain-containing protein [Bacteroidota bacterium]